MSSTRVPSAASLCASTSLTLQTSPPVRRCCPPRVKVVIVRVCHRPRPPGVWQQARVRAAAVQPDLSRPRQEVKGRQGQMRCRSCSWVASLRLSLSSSEWRQLAAPGYGQTVCTSLRGALEGLPRQALPHTAAPAPCGARRGTGEACMYIERTYPVQCLQPTFSAVASEAASSRAAAAQPLPGGRQHIPCQARGQPPQGPGTAALPQTA